MKESGTKLNGAENNCLTAIEWKQKLESVYKDLRSSRYNPDLYKLYKNIQEMVTELSKIEVQDRQHKTNYNAQAQSDKIKSSVDYLEKMILILKLTD